MSVELKHILLSDIYPSKTNPRKLFDQNKIDELAASIAVHEVIQSVLLRPKGDSGKFELVSGERRYRASKQIGKKDIPAVIKQLTDQEVREIQLTENFQREDIHPMEEAVAILSAIKLSRYTIEDLANKVGKPKKYIAQRYKLNDLIPDLQKLFFDNKINLTGALKLVTISAIDQKLYLQKIKTQGSDYYFHSNQIDYYITQCQGNLNKAAFDLKDPDLSPEFGPCTTCRFNSRNANLLFPDDTKVHVCMNNQDFKYKTDQHFKKASLQAFQDPTMVLITSNYGFGPEEKALKEEGHIVLRKYEDFITVEPPEHDKLDPNEYDTREEYEEAVMEENSEYEKSMLVYEKKQLQGKLVKAFFVAGDEKGKTVFVELSKKGNQKTATTVINAGTPAMNDITTELTRLEEREVRAKELDQEKVFADVQRSLFAHEPFVTNTAELSAVEYCAVVISLYDVCYSSRDILKKDLKIKDSEASQLLLLQKLQELGSEAMPHIYKFLRGVIAAKAVNCNYLNPTTDAGPAIITTIAKDYIPDQVSQFEIDQQQATVKRIEKLEKRLVQLRQQKYDLETAAKNKKVQKKLAKDRIT